MKMYIAIYILSLLDLFFTLYEARIFGADIELNPFGNVLITNIPLGVQANRNFMKRS